MIEIDKPVIAPDHDERLASSVPLRVFVAEDNAADVFWLEMVLRTARLDYSLVVVTDGQAAKEYLQQHAGADPGVPDLIFLDQNMPHLTAFEVLRELAATDQTPFCILTGSPTEQEQFVKEFGQPTHRYILKPLTQSKLVDFFQCYESLRPLAEEIMRGSPAPSSEEHG
jgi:CheY-like chemotaxis protein